MSQHPNVRLAPRGRNLLCERIGGSHGKPMTDRPCRPRALVMFTPPEAEDLVCEDAADLLLGTSRRDGRAARALRARGARELFHVDLRKVAREPEDGGWRALGHSLQLHGPGPGLPQGARRHCGARDGRQQPGLPIRRPQRGAGGVRHHRAQVHPSFQPPAERQGRADEPARWCRNGSTRGPDALHRPLRLGPITRRVRGAYPNATHSR